MYEFGQAEIDAATRVLRSGQLFRYRGGERGEVYTFERALERLRVFMTLAVMKTPLD